jgi:hypothetical protein
VNEFFTKAELASDAHCGLTRATTLREFLVTAASILGDLCDEVMPATEEREGAASNYEGFCKWVEEYPIGPGLEGWWEYYWASAASVFYNYDQHSGLSDWELYEQMVWPSDPEWDPSIDDKEEYMKRRITETCFAITRFVRGHNTAETH